MLPCYILFVFLKLPLALTHLLLLSTDLSPLSIKRSKVIQSFGQKEVVMNSLWSVVNKFQFFRTLCFHQSRPYMYFKKVFCLFHESLKNLLPSFFCSFPFLCSKLNRKANSSIFLKNGFVFERCVLNSLVLAHFRRTFIGIF